MTFFKELKRRNVFKVGAAYAIVAWLLIQIASILLPTFGAPHWVMPVFSALVILGFPIALVLAWAFEVTPEGIKPTSEVAASESIAHVTGQKLNYTIIGVLVLALGFVVVNSYVLKGSGPKEADANATTARQAQASSVLPNSVAVLPFENLSPKPDDAYFAAGLHQEVLDQLSKIRSMSVIARASVMQYATGNKPIPEIARELHVGTIMEGSVRFANDRVRVTTQLVDAVTGTNLWSETYERPLGDVFKIEADIAMNVANALQAQFSPEEAARIEKAPTKSPEAYTLYLQARTALDSGDPERGAALLRQALAIDSEFAQAYATTAIIQGLSAVNSTAGNAIAADKRAEMEALSRKNAERAIEIDPYVPGAHMALAGPAVTQWRWGEAEKEFKRALDVVPSDIGARRTYGWLLSWTGRHDEAILLAKRAVELNPDDPNAGGYGMQLGYAGQYSAAVEVFQRTIAMQPTDQFSREWLALMEIARGNPNGAIKQLRLSEQLTGANRGLVFLPEWAYGYGRTGRREDAERLFKEIKDAVDKGAEPGAGGWAMAYLAIGDEKQALEWLEKGAKKAANHEPDEGLYNLMNLRMNITNDPVLKKLEFVRVLSRIKGD